MERAYENKSICSYFFRKVLNDMFDFILVGKQMINETCVINANSLVISAKMQTFISKILTGELPLRLEASWSIFLVEQVYPRYHE